MAGKSRAEMRTAAAEEEWYHSPEGRRQTQREFERAIRRGDLLRSEGSTIPLTDTKLLAKLVQAAKDRTTKPISIRLPIADLERAKQIAARGGVGYQTVLKRAIRTGLRKAS